MEIYITGVNIRDNKRKKAILLHFLGEEGQDLYETLKGTEPADNQYEHAIEKFNEYFLPKKNIPFERHIFNSRSHLKSETVAAYTSRLRILAKSCEFDTLEEQMIRDHIVQTCSSACLRRKLLQEASLTIESLLDTARRLEVSTSQAAVIEKKETEIEGNYEEVNKVIKSR